MADSPLAVLVNADSADLARIQRVLEGAGFFVVTATSFASAKTLLVSLTPAIVIADIKLEAFNGLHLAALCTIWRPGVPIIITHTHQDPVLAADAKRFGATYVVKTATLEELTRTVQTSLEAGPSPADKVRRSQRKAAPMTTLARIAAADVEVIDVSYEGVRLKLPVSAPASGGEGADAFEVVFPELALSLRAAWVWATQDPASEAWLCGVDVSATDSTELRRWREFVDSVP